jgi:ATP-binding cassette subfamily B protein
MINRDPNGYGVRFLQRMRRMCATLRKKRVPFVQQLTSTECGIACVAMVLAYHGKKVALSELREGCVTGRDGTSAAALAVVARSHGMVVRSYSTSPEQLAAVPVPAILFWGFSHFVVLETWAPNQSQIIDPSRGRLTISSEEFDSWFTGIVLVFEPGPTFQRRSRGRALWRRYVSRIVMTPVLAQVSLQVLAATIVMQITGATLPLVTMVLIDYVVPNRLPSILAGVGIVACVLVVTQSVLTYVRGLLLVSLRARLDVHLMTRFVGHLMSLPLSFFLQRSTGDLMMRLGSGALFRELLATQALAAVVDSAMVAVYIAILCVAMPKFALILSVVILGQVATVVASNRRTRELVQQDFAAKAEEQAFLYESVKGILLLKASATEARAVETWRNLFSRQLNVGTARNTFAIRVDGILTFLSSLCPILLMWTGMAAVLRHEASLGVIVALTSLAAAVLVPVRSLLASAQQFQMLTAYVERVLDVLNTAPDRKVSGQDIPHLGAIDLSDVTFNYGPTSAPALRNVSCRIEPGEKVAIVGPTGSGKTTLALLLLGLYVPTEGEISYGGVDISRIDSVQFRRHFGIVLQDSIIFRGSIRTNIAFNNPALSLDDVIMAARLACLADDIAAMPLQYDTVLSEGGANLSGGQRQRLSIARAIAARPSVLLLDEATSHLDNSTEHMVDSNLVKLGCTRIIIAHRLSTIQNADKILVLNDGKIVEVGTHSELIRNSCYYRELYRSTGLQDQILVES